MNNKPYPRCACVSCCARVSPPGTPHHPEGVPTLEAPAFITFLASLLIFLVLLPGCGKFTGETEAVTQSKSTAAAESPAAADECCTTQAADSAPSLEIAPAAVDECCETGLTAEGTAPTTGNPNAIAIPPAVQKNLGMTFATVERRIIEGVFRVPGVFELRPEARREYHAMMEGRARLHVKQFDRVAAGDMLATLDSPAWRALQHSAVEAEGEIRVAEAHVEVARARLQETEQAIAFLAQRIENLQAANVRQIALESELAELRNQRPRLEAELNAAEVELSEAQEHYYSRLRTMSSVTGLTREAMLAEVETGTEKAPYWHTIEMLEFRAEAEGIVDALHVTNGAWLETGAHILETVDPAAIRFAAQAPQAEINRLSDGLPARIVPPEGGSIPPDEVMPATLKVGFIGHADERVIPVYAEPGQLAAWARPGVSAYLEIVTTPDATPRLAIPEAALVRDELDFVFFRRNPSNKNEALKVKADLGAGDGRWIEVKSGVTDGDEVVVDGAYALKLAGSKNQAPPGYHYHADGALHKDH